MKRGFWLPTAHAGWTALALALLGAAAAQAQSRLQARPQYHIAHEVNLPGDEGWDYLTYEQGGHRLFIAHGTQVQVLDTQKLALAGTIPDTPGVHGVALAPDLGRGYVSAGRTSVIVVFDLKTLARLKEIKSTGENPDAIIYDEPTHRVFAFNGRGRSVTAIDAKSDTVAGTIPLDAKPEFAVSDGQGHVYVNLEDKNSIAVIDPQTLVVSTVWPIGGCEEPSALAMDRTGKRLFTGCGNKLMAVVDATSGKVLGTAPIGEGVDAAAYDPGARLAFASCGEGVVTAIAVTPSGAPEVAQTIPTQRGARTMALDEHSHRIFTVTADFGTPPAATPEHPHPRPPILPGTFRVLVLEKTGMAVRPVHSGRS
ncbi:MAG TPA: YncE family protein [Steroidobacteraceae bacterium]|nr:YncE family protein [Steroidobacteraceae bacterium]